MRTGKAVVIGMLLALTSGALADTRDDVLSGIERCGVIQDDRTWLDCLYGAEQPMRGRLGLPPAPEFQQRLVPPVSASAPPQARIAQPARTASQPRRKPGFFGTLFGDAPPVAVSRMASYRYDKNGAFIVTLENGQEWHQADVQGGTVSWIKPASAYSVTITDGAFGSYNLRTDDSPQIYKVERVR